MNAKIVFDEEHLEDGSKCPACGGYNIIGKSLELLNSNIILRFCLCSICGTQWQDEYELSCRREV